jgi:hypothetical protein
VRPVKGGEHGQIKQTPGLAVKPRPAPSSTPAVFSDELLYGAAEIVCLGYGSIHVFIAQHLPANLETFFEKFTRHRYLPSLLTYFFSSFEKPLCTRA